MTQISIRPGVARLALALGLAVLMAACGGGGDEASDTGAAGGSAVTIEGFAFKPDSITVAAGSTVTWTNKDSVVHSVQPSDNLFPTSPNIGGDTPFEHTYGTAGTFPYVCGIHNYMTGTVVVT